jgi:hypothetical protein
MVCGAAGAAPPQAVNAMLRTISRLNIVNIFRIFLLLIELGFNRLQTYFPNKLYIAIGSQPPPFNLVIIA